MLKFYNQNKGKNLMRVLLALILFVAIIFGFNKPIEQEVTIHSHNHTHIIGIQHAHEHAHVETNLPLFYNLDISKEPFEFNTTNFILTQTFVPENQPLSIFRPPIS